MCARAYTSPRLLTMHPITKLSPAAAIGKNQPFNKRADPARASDCNALCTLAMHAHAKILRACVSTFLRLTSVGICLTGRALYASGDVKTSMLINPLN